MQLFLPFFVLSVSSVLSDPRLETWIQYSSTYKKQLLVKRVSSTADFTTVSGNDVIHRALKILAVKL